MTGAPECCTAPCEVLGTGIPQWRPINAQDVGSGGIIVEHAGVAGMYVGEFDRMREGRQSLPSGQRPAGNPGRCVELTLSLLRLLRCVLWMGISLRLRHRPNDPYKCPYDNRVGAFVPRTITYVMQCNGSLPIGQRECNSFPTIFRGHDPL